MTGDSKTQFAEGKLDLLFYGRKLRGAFKLLRMGNREKQWLLMKGSDKYADTKGKIKLVLNSGED